MNPGIDQGNDGLSSKALQLPERPAHPARSKANPNNHTRKLSNNSPSGL